MTIALDSIRKGKKIFVKNIGTLRTLVYSAKTIISLKSALIYSDHNWRKLEQALPDGITPRITCMRMNPISEVLLMSEALFQPIHLEDTV